MERKILYSIIFVNIANVLDTLTTYVGLAFFDRFEKNFLMSHLFNVTGDWGYLIKLVMVLFITIMVYYLVELIVDYKKNRERYGKVIYRVLVGFYIFIGIVYTAIALLNTYRIAF